MCDRLCWRRGRAAAPDRPRISLRLPPRPRERRLAHVLATARNRISVAQEQVPNLASQMRVAFSSMAWNTGSSSPGELRDDLQHLRGRRLLLQRFGEIVGALAQLVEQPRVLDGDDGLGGKVRDQLDLLVGERPHLLTVDDIKPIGWSSLSIGK